MSSSRSFGNFYRSLTKFLSILAIAVVGLSSVADASAAITCRSNATLERKCSTSTSCPVGWAKISNSCSTQTVGGIITYVSDHGKAVKCTWAEFQGEWSSQSQSPVTVSHSVQGPGNYATCSGWDFSSAPTGNPDHTAAPYGYGKFFINVTYQSTNTTTCIEDPNAGIGNNCVKFTDLQNKKHGDTSGLTSGATLACANNNPGTTLTYQFFCADGASVTGFMTLVPSLDGGTTTQLAPSFTGPCSPERVAAGKCTMVLGGVPTKTVKIAGKYVTVVDSDKCALAFPAQSVPNAFDSAQTQNLDSKQMLFYVEKAYTGSCDSNMQPTEVGDPTAAYGVHCQSNIAPFSDNTGDNYFPNDPPSDGFDNELRVCQTASGNMPHTAAQDVEMVELNRYLTVDFQPTLNLNCTSGDNTDSGVYKVWIKDQPPVMAADIVTSPLSAAPKLEGVSPIRTATKVDLNGVTTLELTYPTCSDLSANVINAYNPANNSNVTLHLTDGTTKPTTSLNYRFKTQFEVKVNGL